MEELFKIIAAANYMTIKPLLDLCCLFLTFEMQGKSADEVRWVVYRLDGWVDCGYMLVDRMQESDGARFIYLFIFLSCFMGIRHRYVKC